MLRRMLLTAALVAGCTAVVAPAASAGPATSQCPSGGVKVAVDESPATVSVMDSTTAAPVSIVVTITGPTFEISAATDTATPPLDATWCVKSSTKVTAPSPGTGLTGHSPSTNKKGVAQNIGHVVVYTVTTLPAVTACYDNDSDEGNGDLSVVDTLGTQWNTWIFSSLDGSCSGDVWQGASVVAAADEAAAVATCTAIAGEPDTAKLLSSWSYVGAPADWWMCGHLLLH